MSNLDPDFSSSRKAAADLENLQRIRDQHDGASQRRRGSFIRRDDAAKTKLKDRLEKKKDAKLGMALSVMSVVGAFGSGVKNKTPMLAWGSPRKGGGGEDASPVNPDDEVWEGTEDQLRQLKDLVDEVHGDSQLLRARHTTMSPKQELEVIDFINHLEPTTHPIGHHSHRHHSHVHHSLTSTHDDGDAPPQPTRPKKKGPSSPKTDSNTFSPAPPSSEPPAVPTRSPRKVKAAPAPPQKAPATPPPIPSRRTAKEAPSSSDANPSSSQSAAAVFEYASALLDAAVAATPEDSSLVADRTLAASVSVQSFALSDAGSQASWSSSSSGDELSPPTAGRIPSHLIAALLVPPSLTVGPTVSLHGVVPAWDGVLRVEGRWTSCTDDGKPGANNNDDDENAEYDFGDKTPVTLADIDAREQGEELGSANSFKGKCLVISGEGAKVTCKAIRGVDLLVVDNGGTLVGDVNGGNSSAANTTRARTDSWFEEQGQTTEGGTIVIVGHGGSVYGDLVGIKALSVKGNAVVVGRVEIAHAPEENWDDMLNGNTTMR